MRKVLISFLLVLVGAAGLLYPVWYNGYPLVYSDTGTYVCSGFLNQVPADRPIVYGLFIRHLGLGLGLRFFVLVQSILVSTAIYAACSLLVKDTGRWVYTTYGIIMSVLIGCTALPWVTSWIMPDIFSGVSALLLVVLLFAKQPLFQNKWLVLLYIACTLTHLSNILSHVLALSAVSLLFILQRIIKGNTTISAKRLFTVGLVVLGNYAVMIMINYGFERKVFISSGSTIFLTAKLCDYGLVNTYLHSNCPGETPRLCELKDSIKPRLDHFLWDGNSVLYKMGGWNHPSDEFRILNRHILTTPELLKIYLTRGVENSFDQVLSFDIGQDFVNYGDSSSPPFVAVDWFMKKEVTAYQQSKQNTGELLFPFNTLNWTQLYTIVFMLLVGLVVCFSGTYSSSKWVWITTVILLLTNAIVCAFLTSVGGRYQSRVVWIVVVVAVIEAINNRNYFIKVFATPKS
jgi:hypothetical protein